MNGEHISVFMIGDDEREYSDRLIEADATIVFIDGDRWPTPDPPAVAAIADCSSRFVYVWSRRRTPTVPALRRPDGLYQGPMAGPVVQLERSILNGTELLSGSVALASARDGGGSMAKVARRALDEVAPVTAETLAGSHAPHCRIGRHAARWYRENPGPVWSRQDPGHRLKDRSVDLYLRPAPNEG